MLCCLPFSCVCAYSKHFICRSNFQFVIAYYTLVYPFVSVTVSVSALRCAFAWATDSDRSIFLFDKKIKKNILFWCKNNSIEWRIPNANNYDCVAFVYIIQFSGKCLTLYAWITQFFFFHSIKNWTVRIAYLLSTRLSFMVMVVVFCFIPWNRQALIQLNVIML